MFYLLIPLVLIYLINLAILKKFKAKLRGRSLFKKIPVPENFKNNDYEEFKRLNGTDENGIVYITRDSMFEVMKKRGMRHLATSPISPQSDIPNPVAEEVNDQVNKIDIKKYGFSFYKKTASDITFYRKKRYPPNGWIELMEAGNIYTLTAGEGESETMKLANRYRIENQQQMDFFILNCTRIDNT